LALHGFDIGRWVAAAALLAGVLALAAPALAQQSASGLIKAAPQPEPAPAEPRFEIRRFVIVGNERLTDAELGRRVEPYEGKERRFADIQNAVAAIRQAYAKKGLTAVQVVLPEQALEGGVVRIRVVEGRLARVRIEGRTHSSEASVRRALPALREGEPPDARALAANLRVANENPSRQTTVVLRAGEAEGDVEASVRVADERPWRASVALDNTGTPATGRYRLGVGFQHANLFDRDHVLSMQAITSPQANQYDQVKIFGAGYRVPLYNLGGQLDFVAGYSDVSSGTVQNLFNVSGSGAIAGARYTWFMPRLFDVDSRLAVGFDYRAFRNNVTLVGSSGNLVPNITTTPLSLTWNGVWRAATTDVSGYVSAARNIPDLFGPSSDADFKASRADARAAFRVFRYGAAVTQALPSDLQLRASFSGQSTPDALVAGEQFGVGGFDSVRGFFERAVANDRGLRGSVELYSPDFGGTLERVTRSGSTLRMRALMFYDRGTVSRNSAQPGELTGETIASAGVGLRLTAARNLSVRLDAAQVTEGGGGLPRHTVRVQGSVAYVY
jgi:hemolysin activation/secretion protein